MFLVEFVFLLLTLHKQCPVLLCSKCSVASPLLLISWRVSERQRQHPARRPRRPRHPAWRTPSPARDACQAAGSEPVRNVRRRRRSSVSRWKLDRAPGLLKLEQLRRSVYCWCFCQRTGTGKDGKKAARVPSVPGHGITRPRPRRIYSMQAIGAACVG